MARPTKLTQEVSDQICEALEIGATRTDAVLSSGVSYPTFLSWIERGRNAKRKNDIYLEFLKRVELSEAKARLKFTKTIYKAADEGDWRAAEAYLKRRDRTHWGDVVDVLSGGKPIGKMTDDELIALYAKLSRDGTEKTDRE